MGKSRKSKSATVPIHGDMAHNTGFLLGIGGLVVNWANNESVFLAMLQALLGAKHRTVAIVWHSHRTTVGRLELISRLARDRIEDETLVADIDRAIIRFKGACRTRNFFCHATYDYDSEMRLQSAHGITLTQDGDPISFVYKPMEAATLNEIIDASMKSMLNKIAEVFEGEVESSVMSMTSLIEPLMILIMGIAVGFIVLSICLPIFEMNQLVM